MGEFYLGGLNLTTGKERFDCTLILFMIKKQLINNNNNTLLFMIYFFKNEDISLILFFSIKDSLNYMVYLHYFFIQAIEY